MIQQDKFRSVGMLKATTACALALAASGCQTTSVVQSAPLSGEVSTEALGRGRAYLTYFLPQTIFVATVKEEASAPAEADEAAPAAAKAAAAAPAADPKPDCKDVSAAQAPLARAHNAYVEARRPAVAELTAALAMIDSAKADADRAPSAARAEVVARVEQMLAAAKGELATVKAQDATDRARLLQIEPLMAKWNAHCAKDWVVELTTTVVPDRTRPYALILQDDDYSADTVTLGVDANGLLTSVSTTADEKTGVALTAAVTSLGNIIGAAGLAPMPSVPGPAPVVASAAGLQTLERRIEAFRRDLARVTSLTTELIGPLMLPPPYPLRFTLAELLEPAGQTIGGPEPITLKAECSPVGGVLQRGAEIKPLRSDGEGYRKAVEGVAISTPRACQVTAVKADTTRGYYPTWSVVALDSRAPVEGHLLRTQLISRGSTYAFENGRVTTITSTKPSNAAAGWALPGSVVGSFFGGIVTGIQGPKSVYEEQAKYLAAKKSIYEAEAAVITAKAALIEARKAKDESGEGDDGKTGDDAED